MFTRNDSAEKRSLLEKPNVADTNQNEGVGSGAKSETNVVGGSLDAATLGAAAAGGTTSGAGRGGSAVPTMGPPSDRALAGKSVLVDEASDLVLHSSRLGAAFYGSTEISHDRPQHDRSKVPHKVPYLSLYRYATGLDWFLLIFGALGAVVQGSGWPVLYLFLGIMLDDFITFNTANLTQVDVDNVTMHTTRTLLQFVPSINNNEEVIVVSDQFELGVEESCIRFALVGLAVMISSYIQTASFGLTGERQTNRLRKAFFHSILHQEISWFDFHQTGEITSKLSDDIEKVKSGYGENVGIFLQFLGQIIAGFILAFTTSWELTLVIMAVLPVLVISSGFMAHVISVMTKQEMKAYSQAGGVAEEVLSCIRTVTAFGGQKKELERYEKELLTAKAAGIKKGITSGLGIGMSYLFYSCTYALSLWYGPKMVSEGRITGGDVVTVFFCIWSGSASIGNLTPSIHAIASARGSAVAIYDVIDSEPEIDKRKDKGMKPKSVEGHLEFRHVRFSYPIRQDVPVLRDLSMKVNSGQRVALVGSSGCGKSTIVKLLLRFYSHTSGEICIDGIDIRDLNVTWLRENIGVVSQEPTLFNCSIKQNIEYGHEGVSDAEIVEAAKKANAHQFISSLPKGYDTVVGERGAQLSGGQKQRVAIARALVRNPRILLLDEATSALDSESEKLVQEALDKAQEGRTTLVIAHRLSTVQNADLIIVIKEGHVAESGNHKELMNKESIYRQLVTLQMFKKRDDFISDDDARSLGRQSSLNESVPSSPSSDSVKYSSANDELIVSLNGNGKLHMEEEEIPSKGKKKNKKRKKEKSKTSVPELSYRDILRLNAPECHYIIIGCIFAAFLGAALPTLAILLTEIIRIFSLPPKEIPAAASFWSLMFIVLGVVRAVSIFISMLMFSISGELLTLRLRKKAFWAILRQDAAWFDEPHHNTGSLANVLATDASNVQGATGLRISTLIHEFVTVLIAVIIAFVYGWQLALFTMCAVPLMTLWGRIQMAMLTGTQKQDSHLLQEASKIASEAVENITTVSSLMLEERIYHFYCEKLREPLKKIQKHKFFFAFAVCCSQASVFFLFAAAFRFGGHLVAIGQMSSDAMFKVIIVITYAGIALGQAAAFMPDFSKAKLSAAKLVNLIALKPPIDNYSTEGLKPNKIDGYIKCNNLTFRYPNRPGSTILDNLNLNIKPGQTMALVGESGCGKSTMVALMERFYDPNFGCIQLDGNDLRELNIGWLRSNMSIVSQEPVLFACSVRDNIAYGVEEDLPQEEVERVAKMANIHDFIVSLPLGYDTLVGEKGAQLSGGQKQRVAIARALARNPRILLFDEATSALDTESEQIVQTALDNAMEGRTSIVVAQRLNTIQNSDQIAVIRDGNIVEQGRHQELVSRKGHYYTLTMGQHS
ncbi:ATP-dependent translocase ABCB1-like [Lytechinus pictus]|uniref:ATP-dependent translocase ABCB1-like n=1 Tax=Lytechinus pictus TaxID=7653 RepID=UPI0030BA1D37